MNFFVALWIVWSSPYVFRSRHEWRGVSIDRTGLWPLVTIGRSTWDALGPGPGARHAEMLKTMREHGGDE